MEAAHLFLKRQIAYVTGFFQLGSHSPSSRVDPVCAVFSCVPTMVWLPILEIFNVCIDVSVCDSTQGLYKYCTSLLKVDCDRKFPCHTGE